MSVLLLVLSALVLIYFSIGGKTAAIVMSVATLIGVANDDWHILSFLIGGILLALALLITLPGDLRLDKFSRPLGLGPQPLAQAVADRTGSPCLRLCRLGRRTVLRQAGMEQAAGRSPRAPDQ